jgi:hypothetical protein
VVNEVIAPLDPNPSAFPTNFLHKYARFHSMIQPAFLPMLNPQRPPPPRRAMLPPLGRPDARAAPLLISSATPFACFRDLPLLTYPLLLWILLSWWRIVGTASAPTLKTEVMASPALTQRWSSGICSRPTPRQSAHPHQFKGTIC